MAAHLKKRAYEDFSHVIHDSAKPMLKKLRLTRATPPDSVLAQQKHFAINVEGQSSKAVFENLVRFSKKLPVPAEHVQQYIDALIKLLGTEHETSNRVKIMWLLGELCSTVGFHPIKAMDGLMALLEKESSGKVISQLWSSIVSTALRLPSAKEIHLNLVKIAQNTLNDHKQEVRCQSLMAISKLLENNLSLEMNNNATTSSTHHDVHNLVAQYLSDQEPRVRCAALHALITFHQRGQVLELSVYDQACSALNDDFEQVRMTAVQLVWILSFVYPEHFVLAPRSEETIRLVDDAFAKICDLINDSSYKVRAESARLLGSMHLVSDNFLFQTLDKKIMSDLKRKKSLNEMAKEGFVEEFSTGAKWADDAPPREHTVDTATLMTSGACGAFVHGLEDEMMEVRTATVDSLTELASQRSKSSFAQAALDFLVDCLNDEIEAVRLNAVNSLHKIVEQVTLLEDQLNNVHSAMEDACKEIREGIHQLLSCCRLMSKACLYETVMMLLKNLNKYPQDRLSVWKTQQKLGEHHSELVYLLAPQLLSAHPYFDTWEPEMDDPSYVSILILIFNACTYCPQIAQVFPEHVVRHYQYLKDSIPDMVPQQLKMASYSSGVDICIKSPPHSMKSSYDVHEFLLHTMQRIQDLQRHDNCIQKTLLQSTIKDLRHIADVAPKLSATAGCCADFLQAKLLLSKAVDSKGWSSTSHISSQHLAFAKPAVQSILQLTYQLQHLYMGLSTEEVALIMQLRIKANALGFVLEIQEASMPQTNKIRGHDEHFTDIRRSCDSLFIEIKKLKSFLNKHDIVPDTFSKTIFNELLKLPSTCKPSLVGKLLQPLLSHYSVAEVNLNNKAKKANVIINEPQSSLDSTISFTAGLIASVNVDAMAYNISNPIEDVKVQVEYPDSTVHTFPLLCKDVKQLSKFKYRINTLVYLSHVQWSDSCVIKLSFVKSIMENDENISSTELCKTVPLSKVVTLSMYTKPTPRV